jgi:hypothetical protein
MKVITSIYLNCRPELRDEWLGGTDQDTELEDALVSLDHLGGPKSNQTATRIRSSSADTILQQEKLPHCPTSHHLSRATTSPNRFNFCRHARRPRST